jgi:hypothetical protein
VDEQPCNVVPLPNVHICASCGAPVTLAQRFELSAHTPECRQPEIRMRRAEAEIAELRATVLALARHVLTPGACLAPEECGASDLCPCRSTSGQFHGTCGINETVCRLINEASRKTHGNSEASPDTQRSAGSNDGLTEQSVDALDIWGNLRRALEASDSRCAHANASAAEPASPSE